MKYILSLIIILGCYISAAQDTAITTTGAMAPRLDTARVVMLVSDTTHVFTPSYTYPLCQDSLCKEPKPHFHTVNTPVDAGPQVGGFTVWVYGYAVRTMDSVTTADLIGNPQEKKLPRLLFYLNSDKKQMNKNVIVWGHRLAE